MDLLSGLRLAGRHWVLLVVCAVLGAIAAQAFTLRQEPVYAASTTLFVSAAARDGSASSAYQASLLSRDRIKSYASLLTSDRLVTTVAAQLGGGLGAEQLRESISTEVVPDTVLLRATVRHGDPAKAKVIADAVGAEFAVIIAQLEQPAPNAPPTVRAAVIDQARVPTGPVSPRPLLNLALGLLAGLGLGVGGSLLREAFDTTVQTAEEMAEVSGARMLGEIGFDAAARTSPLITDGAGHSQRAEAFRSLRTNLQFISADEGLRRVVFTSALPKEGKSTTVCNLAIALAQAGRRVIVVDGDLRRPRIASYLGMSATVGLSDVLADRTDLNSVLRPWGGLPLQVLPSGPTPYNPSELLGSPKMRDVLDQLSSLADVVLVDAPPLLPVTDAAVLARSCDGAVLLARSRFTTREQLSQAAAQLRAVDVRVLGSVLTMASPQKLSGYGYGYASQRESFLARG